MLIIEIKYDIVLLYQQASVVWPSIMTVGFVLFFFYEYKIIIIVSIYQ